MEVERRALYNLLRLNWQLDPNLMVEPWQVENYRSYPLEKLFSLLTAFDIYLDRTSFAVYADNCDSPEELTETLRHEDLSPELQDQAYLILFELWRRLVPERPSISILCDEMDHQINLYDQSMPDTESLQDAIASLQEVLEENIDRGVKPKVAFKYVSSGCAHDVENFLFDFISEQIDNKNFDYAHELLEGFSQYMEDAKWFEFLNARIIANDDPEEATALVQALVKKHGAEKNLEFNLDALAFLSKQGDKTSFVQLLKKTVPLLEEEEDLRDVLRICADYCHFLDQDENEQLLKKMLSQRIENGLDMHESQNDAHIATLLKIMEKK